jgi:hypothetical protein
MAHGDEQYAPEQLPGLLAPLRDDQADAVFGSRMLVSGAARKGGMPLYKWLGNRILTASQNLLLGTRLSEFQPPCQSVREKQPMLRHIIKSIARKLPGFGPALAELDQLRRDCGFVPPGHFYSPIPSWAELKQDEGKIFSTLPREISGINLRETEQSELLKALGRYYPEQPFTAQKKAENRYYFENSAYSYSDAIIFYCMLRHLHPKRLVEVGSGFSSCVALDTSEQFLDGSIDMTFIEPYPDMLYSLVKEEEKQRLHVLRSRLQDVQLEVFDELATNDILFIDSTHVAKTNSDVNRLFFEILPRLKPGVYVHIHDVFFPFEYPREWIFGGRAWNELYLLRAFLQYNSKFEIVLMNTFMEHFHEGFFRENLPLCLENKGGSLWLRKV